MRKVKKLFLVLTALVSILGTLNSQAVIPTSSGSIVLGEWNSNLAAGIAYSDANDIPMVFVWGRPGCANCSAFDSDLSSSTFKTWQADRQIVMVYVKNEYGSSESKWARGLNSYAGTVAPQNELYGFPYVVAYWKSKNAKGYNFESKTLNASETIAHIESFIGDYTGADLASVEVIGPSTVMEGLNYNYQCQALDTNGKTKDVTSSATWSENSPYATISSSGVLSVDPINSDQQIIITATYTSGDIQKSDTHQVTITDVTLGGSGTDVDPFLLTTASEFMYMTYNTADYDKHYKLMADVDLTGESFFRSVIAPNAAAETSFSGTAFTGELDGNGFVVRNVNINAGSGECFLGFFGKIYGADIHCLGVENITVAGDASSSRYVGGFCGQNDGSTVAGCYVANAAVTGNSFVGGFAGLNSYGSDVDNCYARGSVTGGSNVGGFCGYNYQSSSIDSSYAACVITGGASGGFSALLDTDNSTIGTSFWDTDVSGLTSSAGATGKTTAEMQTEATFTGAGWDFATIWEMDDYPILSCFGEAPGPVDIKYSGGAGTEASPYQLADKEDLLCLATNVPDYDKYFKLTADIDLSGESFDTAVIAPDADGSNEDFDGTLFTGSFDGDGHSIDNLSITAGNATPAGVSTLIIAASGTNDCLGLFGGMGGVIKNLAVNNAVIVGGDGSIYNGVLCGYTSCGSITTVKATGSISGGSKNGGLCGYISGTEISECFADVDVSGSSVLGGFCAENFCGIITDCYASGSVTGDMIAGGFCAHNSGEIANCHSVAAVAASWDVGGFCYTNQIEDGCGMCGPPGTVYYGTVSNSFWDTEASGVSQSDGAVGKTSAEMAAEATFTASGWDIGGTWYMNAYPELNAFYRDYNSGSGTEADPYVIKTKREFLNFAAATNDYSGYFTLAADIDLDGEIFNRAVIAPNTTAGTTYSGTAFTGSFDGNGYVIRNVNITTAGSDECFLGLFGKLEGAEVSCLGLADVSVTDASGTSQYVGGFCGQNRNSFINECRVNNALIEASQLVGGFCGLNSYGGSVSNCYVKGAVTADTMLAGGFCGYNYNGSSIDNSYAVCTISCPGQKGGFCADTLDTSTVGNCFWDTDVSALTTSYGGTGEPTADMQTQATFTGAGWDFADIWAMDEYPELHCFCQSSGSCAELIVVNGEGSGMYTNGAEVVISANVPEGYIFTHWTMLPSEFAANVSNSLDAVTTVIVPAAEFTVTANFLKRPDIEPVFAGAQPNEWTMDYQAALAYAKTNDLYTIFMFSGSWWCPDCFSFDENVLQNPVWQDYLNNNPVMLVMLDYEIRPVYGVPRENPMNHCFLWDEQFITNNGITSTEAEARLAEFHAIETEYSLPSTIAAQGYPRLNYPSFVIHRPDGSRAGRMSLEEADNPNVTNVIRRIEQAMLSDNPSDEMDDEALINPQVLDIPEDENLSSTPVDATLSEIDLADNYSFEASAGGSYVFNFSENNPYPAVPLMVTILGPDGLDVVDSAEVDPASAGSGTFDGLSNGTYFVKVSLQNPVTNLVGYTLSASRDYPYSGGSGTEADPYLIGDKGTFMEMVNTPADYGMHFELSADIDLAGEVFSRAVIAPNTASGVTYAGTAFTGSFDGNGYVIRNVNITTVGSDECFLGLFGKLYGAVVTRLGVVGVNVTDASGSSQYVGSFCGQLDGSTVNQCYVNDVSLDVYQLAGGFCGLNSYGSSVSNCFATASVTCSSYAGGFCAYNYQSSSINNSYAVGSIECAGTKGGFCADTLDTSTVGNCFWDTDVSGVPASSGGTGKTTADMQTLGTFTGAGWSFISIWYMNGYPQLASCSPVGTFRRWLSDAALALADQDEESTPAGDGVANLLKFASGLEAATSATTSDLMYLPAEKSAGQFEVIFYKAKVAEGVDVVPFYATSPAGPWSSLPVTAEKIGEDGDRELWKASVPEADRGFIKLQAESR